MTALAGAAQYVRMSTEHQKYSIDNQKDVIAAWATLNGYEIVRTYEDRGKSGLALKNRPGLQQLLADVTAGPAFEAILVYDVSRWGRFQNSDEAAHYEFVCTEAGIPVHYCAEAFVNDGNISSLLLKALKRIMAGEYSRDLSRRVRAGITRIVRLGYNPGGSAPYGFQRMLISADGGEQRVLRLGQRKALTTDRVKLIRGPEDEIASVQLIYNLTLAGKGPSEIAKELNAYGSTFHGRPWLSRHIWPILRNPKYAGVNIWARRASSSVGGSRIAVPRDRWVASVDAVPAIVAPCLFDSVQATLENRRKPQSDEQLIGRLREILRQEGKLSGELIARGSRSHGGRLAHVETYRKRFGSLLNAYASAGFDLGGNWAEGCEQRKNTIRLHNELVRKVIGIFPDHFQIDAVAAHSRKCLLVDGRLRLMVALCSRHRRTRTLHWLLNPVRVNPPQPLLLCALEEGNHAIGNYYLLKGFAVERFTLISDSSALFRDGLKLDSLAELYTGLWLRFRNELMP